MSVFFLPRFYLLRSPHSAAAILIGYWNSVISPAVWITVCMVVVILINMLGAGVCFVSNQWDPPVCSSKYSRRIWRGRVRLRVSEHTISKPFYRPIDRYWWSHYITAPSKSSPSWASLFSESSSISEEGQAMTGKEF